MTPTAAGGPELGRANSGAKLLMVEDERNVAETLAERLRAAGFTDARAVPPSREYEQASRDFESLVMTARRP